METQVGVLMAKHLEKIVKSTLMSSGDLGFSKNSNHIVTQRVIVERKKYTKWVKVTYIYLEPPTKRQLLLPLSSVLFQFLTNSSTYNQYCCCCSVAQSCLTLCDLVGCSTPGFPVHHYVPQLAQTHVHWVGDAIRLSHPLSPTSPAFTLCQHQGLFQWVSSSHQVATVLELFGYYQCNLEQIT